MSATGQPPAPAGPAGKAAAKKKRQQQLALAAGAAAVLLIFLFTRNQAAATTDTTGLPQGTTDLTGAGLSAGGGGDSGSGGVGVQGDPGLQGDPGVQGDPGPQGDPGAPGLDAQPAPSTPSASVGQPAGAAAVTSKAAVPGMHTAQTGPRAGQQYKTITAHGTVYHQYTDTAGKKTNVPIRPTAAAAATIVVPKAPSSTTSHPSGQTGPVGQPAATTHIAAHGATPGESYTTQAGKGGVWHIYSDHKVFVPKK